MTKAQKILLYTILLFIGIIIVGSILITNSPDGTIGFLLFLIGIYLIIGSIIKLCMLSKKIKSNILYFLDILFWLP